MWIATVRFHKTVLQEFYQVAFRKKIYKTLEELQADLDLWVKQYNEERPHSGKYCFGKTPMQTFLDSIRWPKTNARLDLTDSSVIWVTTVRSSSGYYTLPEFSTPRCILD